MNRVAARHLGLSIALAVFLTAAGGSILWLGRGKLQSITRTNAELAGDIGVLEERYRKTAQDEQLIQATIVQFEDMRRRGLIGPAARLEWADAVRRINQRLRLKEASFSFGPQRSNRLVSENGRFALNTSRMNWRAHLLHEGDLLGALDAFQRIPNALVMFRRCTLIDLRSALPADSAPAAIKYSLAADCELDWITIGESAPNAQASGSPQ